jgi:hypothetical protein
MTMQDCATGFGGAVAMLLGRRKFYSLKCLGWLSRVTWPPATPGTPATIPAHCAPPVARSFSPPVARLCTVS